MDKKTKIFFIIFFLLIAGAVAATYWRIMIKKDYVVEAQTDCEPWTCEPGEKDCSETLCDEITKAEQSVECNDPKEYLLNNPPEEEYEECEEDDEECLMEEEEEILCDEGDEECVEEEE